MEWSRRLRVRWTSSALVVVYGLSLFPVSAQISVERATTKRTARFDPRALALLQKMADAYAQLHGLEQSVEFYSALIPFTAGDSPFATPLRPDETPKSPAPPQAPTGQEPPPTAEGEAPPKPTEIKTPRALKLKFMRPNLFYLELADESGEKPMVYRWVSDGKFFFTYLPERNYYTRDKAPKRLSEFLKLSHINANSFDLLMIMGVNPFEGLKGAMDEVTLEGEAKVRDVATWVVALRSSSLVSDVEYRFFIGKQDNLLRRVVQEETPTPTPPDPAKVGDALDELSDLTQPVQPGLPQTPEDQSEMPLAPVMKRSVSLPMKTRVIYEYLLKTQPVFASNAFQFVVPEGALLYGVDPLKRRKAKDYKTIREQLLKQRDTVFPRN